jgi:hypothetical protein
LDYNFGSRQIVCLEHENTCLYAEIIEFVAQRQVCWVRPLLLAVPTTDNDSPSIVSPKPLILYNLRQGADLLWPACLFRPALDTEVIPLLVQLDQSDNESANSSDAHTQLSCFVREIWQAYKSAFSAS